MKLYKDQHDLFRSKTRLAEANNLPELVKFPIVLPSDSHISKIIILDAHESVLHSRVDSTFLVQIVRSLSEEDRVFFKKKKNFCFDFNRLILLFE